jgi:hypothetical protein
MGRLTSFVSLETYENRTYEPTRKARDESLRSGLPPLGGTRTYELTRGCRDVRGKPTHERLTSIAYRVEKLERDRRQVPWRVPSRRFRSYRMTFTTLRTSMPDRLAVPHKCAAGRAGPSGPQNEYGRALPDRSPAIEKIYRFPLIQKENR